LRIGQRASAKSRLILSFFVYAISEVSFMTVDTKMIVPMTDANRNFSRVVHLVDENGMAVIMKNNKPRYVVVDFDEYDTIAAAIQMRKDKIGAAADRIIAQNLEAFTELAK